MMSTAMDWEAEQQLVLPSAAQGRNQISDIGNGRALSAVSFQHSASEHNRKNAWL
jgi:hypothetical protein